MRTLTSILIIVLILSSCEKRQPKIDYNNQKLTDSVTQEGIGSDTSKILIAELPVCFDSTAYLIHPIGMVSRNGRDSKSILKIDSYSDREYFNSEFSVVSYRQDNFSGNITNLVFENINTRNQRVLTNKRISITYVQYLRDLSKKVNRHYILYSVIDKDLNNNGMFDYSDANSLYISKLDGSEFKKITENSHKYYGGRLIIQDLKYYYRTIEDLNYDGEFDVNDKYHYYYIDFSNDSYKTVEYNPIELVIK